MGLAQTMADPAAATPRQSTTAALTEGVAVSIEAIQTASIAAYSADFRTAHTLAVPTLVSVSSEPPIPTGAAVGVEFDSNLAIPAPGLLLDGGKVVRLPATLTSAGNGRTRASVSIPNGIGSGTKAIQLSLPMSLVDLYPAENLGRPRDILIEVEGPHGVVSRSTLSRTADASSVQPWGVEAGAGWESVDLRDNGQDRTYRYPSSFRVLSVGPSAVPAGMTITVCADERVVRSLKITEVRLNDTALPANQYRVTSNSADGAVVSELLFAGELAADSALTIAIASEAASQPALDDGIVFARAYVAAPSTAACPERPTGRRMAIAISDSGEPVSATDAEGKV